MKQLIAGMLVAMLWIAGGAFAEAPKGSPPATVAVAPQTGMSDDEMGQLVNMVRLTNQPLDDWSGWEARDQEGMDAYRYQAAFMAYALALQQYHSVPAWRELHRATLDRLITRILQKPAWEFWAETSKSKKQFDPDLVEPLESKHDPVGEKNIMYSGHLVHMAALAEMFYHEDKWSKPGAFTFKWDEKESCSYDLQGLLGVIHKEMNAPREKGGACIAGIECEPNLIFPECQQHPLLAFQLNDFNRGTKLYGDTSEALTKFFDCCGMVDPKTKNVGAFWRIKQEKLVGGAALPSASADGWTGAFMHVWKPELVAEAYQKQKAYHVKPDPKGGIQLAFDPAQDLGAAFFATLAVEVGDTETAQALFDYAEKNYGPVREGGALRYPARFSNPKFKVSNTTDKILAMARSNRPNGLRTLHEQPWGKEAFEYPLVAGIDFPRVLVREARWVPGGGAEKRGALVVELAPGAGAPQTATFKITGLKPGEKWSLTRGGKEIGFSGPDGIATGAIKKGGGAGEIEVSVFLTPGCRLELQRGR